MLLSSLSLGMAGLSIDAIVYTVRQPPFVIPDLIKHIPVLPFRSVPRLERVNPIGHGFVSALTKSAASLINSVFRSIENFYNRLLRQMLNIAIRVPIQFINYCWRKLIALIRHLARCIKRLSEQLYHALWSIIKFLYHFVRVIVIPGILIWIVYHHSWQLGMIISQYVHQGLIDLIWSGLLRLAISLGCILTVVWLMTRCAFGSLLMSFTAGLFDFANRLILLYVFVSWSFIAAARYVAPAPFRIEPLTVAGSLWLLLLLAAVLFTGKFRTVKARG